MSSLFEEVRLRHLTLKNRLVRSATQDPFGLPDGRVSDGQVELYRTIAANNVGMVITAHVCVSPEGRAGAAQNGFYDDSFIAGQSAVAAAIKSGGAAAILQISHAGGSVTPYPGVEDVDLIAPVGRALAKGVQPARAMTRADMDRVRDAFAAAAARAVEAGFDGVQVHMAHGYLLSQFLNPCTNTRDDIYGGSAEGRFRFPAEVLAAVRAAVGPDYPVFVKINGNCESGDGGFAEDFLSYVRGMERFGLEGIEVSGWNFTPLGREGRRTYFLDRALAAAGETGTPVFPVGGVRSVEDIQRVLDAGLPLVSMARPFIAEPDLGTKLLSGQKESACISCSKCFYLYGREGRRCVLHPMPEN